jgi:uncharacterized membrane protein
MPDWLTSGSLSVILVIVVGLVLIYAWVNWRMKVVQRNLHKLGRSYYEKEKILIDDMKAGRITRDQYRKKHERLVSEMREDSRRITDGPPM